jgi:hypothetical protein
MLKHLWFADVATPGVSLDAAQNPNSNTAQNPSLGGVLAARLPLLLTLVLRSAGEGGQLVVDTADLAALAAGAPCVVEMNAPSVHAASPNQFLCVMPHQADCGYYRPGCTRCRCAVCCGIKWHLACKQRHPTDVLCDAASGCLWKLVIRLHSLQVRHVFVPT